MKKIFKKAAAIGMLGTALAFTGCTMPTGGSSSGDDTEQVDDNPTTEDPTTDDPTDDTPADDTPADDTPVDKDVIRLGTSMTDTDADIMPYDVDYNKTYSGWPAYQFTEVYFQNSAKFEDGKSYYFEAPDDGTYYMVAISAELNNVDITVVNAALDIVGVDNSTVTITVPTTSGAIPIVVAPYKDVPVFFSNSISGTTLNLPIGSKRAINGTIITNR